MDHLLLSTIVGTTAGILGTGLGGAIAWLLRNPGKRLLSILLSVSAGLMLGVVCFDLLPQSFEMGSFGMGLFGTLVGVVSIALIQEILTKRSPQFTGRLERQNRSHMGLLIGIGIALHNFPEGLAIGVGFTSFQTFGLGLSLVIALHDIPEGIAMAVPMRMEGTAPAKVVLAALLAGLPTGLGALIGYLLGEISVQFIGFCLGFAGGAMLYITCSELIPESQELHRGRISGLGLLFGVILGVILTRIV